jgi:hypothetical protein
MNKSAKVVLAFVYNNYSPGPEPLCPDPWDEACRYSVELKFKLAINLKGGQGSAKVTADSRRRGCRLALFVAAHESVYGRFCCRSRRF